MFWEESAFETIENLLLRGWRNSLFFAAILCFNAAVQYISLSISWFWKNMENAFVYDYPVFWTWSIMGCKGKSSSIGVSFLRCFNDSPSLELEIHIYRKRVRSCKKKYRVKYKRKFRCGLSVVYLNPTRYFLFKRAPLFVMYVNVLCRHRSNDCKKWLKYVVTICPTNKFHFTTGKGQGPWHWKSQLSAGPSLMWVQ